MPLFVDINSLDLVPQNDIDTSSSIQISGTQRVTLQQIANIAINKLNKKLTLKAGDTTKEYNGETPVEWEVTPSNIGAAEASHTHQLSDISNYKNQGKVTCSSENELFRPTFNIQRWDYSKSAPSITSWGTQSESTSLLLRLGYRTMGIDGFIGGIGLDYSPRESGKHISIEDGSKVYVGWSLDAIYVRYKFEKLCTVFNGTPELTVPNLSPHLKLTLDLTEEASTKSVDVRPDINQLSSFLLASYLDKGGPGDDEDGYAVLGIKNELVRSEPVQYNNTYNNEYHRKVELNSKFKLYQSGKLELELEVDITGVSEKQDVILYDLELVHVIPLGMDYIWRYHNQE